MAVAGAAAACVSGPDVTCVTGVKAAQLFEAAIRFEAAGKADRAIAILIALERDADADIRAEARFRLGNLYERIGRPDAAIAAYRRVLDERPAASRVRLELARLLAAQGAERAALAELRRAGSAGLPEDVARVVDAFSTALRSRRRLGATLEIAIAPDSNINRATRVRSIDTVIAPFTLSDDARGRSGVGASIAAQGFVRGRIGGTAALARASLRADLYAAHRFDDVALSIVAGPEFQTRSTRVRPAPIVQRRWFGGRRYSDAAGATVNVLAILSPASQLEIEGTVTANRYAAIRAQNGVSVDAALAYDRALSPKTSARVTMRASRQGAEDRALATRTAAFGALVAYNLGPATMFAQADVTRIVADRRQLLFPTKRADWRSDLTVGAVAQRWRIADLAPLVRVIHTRSRSTVELYDFRRTRVEIGFSREF